MAVYTHITEDGLQAFLEQYDLPPLIRYEGIEQGVENTNYRIFTEGGCYILTLYESRVDPVDLPFFFAFITHLAQRGLPVPVVMAGRDKRVVYCLAGKPAALISYLDGVDIKEDSIAPHHCHEIGKVVAQMHLAAQDFSMTRENTLGLSGWKELARSVLERADEVEAGLGSLIAGELLYQKTRWPEMAALPRGVVHADLFPDNVLFQDDRVSGLIDFYFSCEDFLAYDLALVINAWCFDGGGLVADRWAALRDSYGRIRTLTPAEQESLTVLCRGAALRILLTRLYAWLNHPEDALVTPKDPREYSAILKWHQNETIGR